MRQHAGPEDVDVARADAQVPDEVAAGEGLDHAAGARVAEDALPVLHLAALLVDVGHPQRQRVDQRRLEDADDVDVPVDAGAPVEGRVRAREQAPRDEGRGVRLDRLVPESRDEHLMDVQRQRVKVQPLGEGDDGLRQQRDWRDRERVEHGGLESGFRSRFDGLRGSCYRSEEYLAVCFFFSARVFRLGGLSST